MAYISKGFTLFKSRTYHTNTKQGLEVARHITAQEIANKQIFMITDGKPSCMFEGGKTLKTTGLDQRKIMIKYWMRRKM